jgi:hypothetical protein
MSQNRIKTTAVLDFRIKTLPTPSRLRDAPVSRAPLVSFAASFVSRCGLLAKWRTEILSKLVAFAILRNVYTNLDGALISRVPGAKSLTKHNWRSACFPTPVLFIAPLQAGMDSC